MNSTDPAAGSLVPTSVATFTTIHFVLIALLAAFAVAVLVVGIRRAHLRSQARREVRDDQRAAGMAPAPATPEPPLPPADELPAQPPMADERVAAAASLDASPATVAEPPAAQGAPDPSPAGGPVTQLKGLGPKVAARLAELGITTVGQLAGLDADQAAALDARMGPFGGRLARDRWIDQARFLAAGDRAGFEAVFGRL
jgi:predicted flap endonuclease-1-like 5' DNA nuclease